MLLHFTPKGELKLKEVVRMSREITAAEYELVWELINRILPAYLPNGKLTGDEYYRSILLEDLTKKEYQMLEDF